MQSFPVDVLPQAVGNYIKALAENTQTSIDNTLRKIQEELPKRLQEAGFHIERGEVNSEAVHRTVKQYKADMEKEKADLFSKETAGKRK